MRRADRLFQIVQHLRARRLTTAAQLATRLEVSERTVYRDIRDLSLSGIPIEGEAGVGYRIHRDFELTPLMFTTEEVEAVVAGLRMVQTFTGPVLRAAADSALNKVALALPTERRADIERPRLFAPLIQADELIGGRLDTLRNAISLRCKVEVTYIKEGTEEASCRTLRPLGLYFWGKVWTLAAWCELRTDFRSFRLDRIREMAVLEVTFAEEAGRTLEDFLSMIRARYKKSLE